MCGVATRALVITMSGTGTGSHRSGVGTILEGKSSCDMIKWIAGT